MLLDFCKAATLKNANAHNVSEILFLMNKQKQIPRDIARAELASSPEDEKRKTILEILNEYHSAQDA